MGGLSSTIRLAFLIGLLSNVTLSVFCVSNAKLLSL